MFPLELKELHCYAIPLLAALLFADCSCPLETSSFLLDAWFVTPFSEYNSLLDGVVGCGVTKL